jgi:hypothetical protein
MPHVPWCCRQCARNEEVWIEWECLFVGVSFDDLVEADEHGLDAGQHDDGCVVFAISSRLSAALAEAARSTLKDAAVAGPRSGRRTARSLTQRSPK